MRPTWNASNMCSLLDQLAKQVKRWIGGNCCFWGGRGPVGFGGLVEGERIVLFTISEILQKFILAKGILQFKGHKVFIEQFMKQSQ